MTAEHYLREKERLSQALNGGDRLMKAVASITDILKKYSVYGMKETSFDLMCFTIETIHLDQLDFSRFVP